MVARRVNSKRTAKSAASAENKALRRRVRELERERDEYLHALIAQLKKESKQEDWDDFDPGDYRFSLQEILADFEREEGVCLPRMTTGSSVPKRSAKNSRKSSVRQKR
jgi:hypothetical protein